MKWKRFTKKRAVAAGLAFGMAAGAGGIAAAFFSGSGGTGSGNALVGAPGPFTVTQTGQPGTPLYPNGSQTLTFKITNNGTGTQGWGFLQTQAKMATTSGGNILTAKNGAAVTGCKASWFTPKVAYGSWATTSLLAKGASAPFHVTVAMSEGTNTGSTQDACIGSSPEVEITTTGPVAGFGLLANGGAIASWTTTTPQAKAVANLKIPAGATVSTQLAAEIKVLTTATALPSAAPTLAAQAVSSNGQSEPRWDIHFATGLRLSSLANSNVWTFTGTGATTLTTVSSTSWTAIRSEVTGKTVTEVTVIMTGGTTAAAVDSWNVTHAVYGTANFG